MGDGQKMEANSQKITSKEDISSLFDIKMCIPFNLFS